MPLPCSAPLPTGYCLVSDPGDYVGIGQTYEGGGDGTVEPQLSWRDYVTVHLTHPTQFEYWSSDFAAPLGVPIRPGLYDPVYRYPFQPADVAGMDFFSNGRGCNGLIGTFSVEELEYDANLDVARLSLTFEQHCEGTEAALRGVIHLGATGVPDPTPAPDRAIPLEGTVLRVAYDPTSNVAYGLDETNERLSKIDLESGNVTYADAEEAPNAACVDAARGRLFVVSKASNAISEYETDDLSKIRDIAWAPLDSDPSLTHFEIHCAPDRLYVVDGAAAPGLFTVTGLDGSSPVVTNQTAKVAGVGSLVLNQANTDLYYWRQIAWDSSNYTTAVRRVLTTNLGEVDATNYISWWSRNPVDAPILLDETRGLIFSKNRVFGTSDLTTLLYTLPGGGESYDGSRENAYALDAERGHLATKDFVYNLDGYEPIAMTAVENPDQLFFGADGTLWFLSVSQGALLQQLMP